MKDITNKMKKIGFKRDVTIYLDNNNRSYEYIESPYALNLSLLIFTNKNDSFDKCINNKKAFNKAVELFNSIESADKEKTSMNYDEFFKKDYTLSINGTVEDIIEFLNNNVIQCDKIVLSPKDEYMVEITNNKFIEKLIDNLDSINNIYVEGSGNREAVKLLDYKRTIEYIDNIAAKIKEKDLSPIEQLMYIYDIVRDRLYIKEDDDEDYTVSRDLTSVTSGEKIVCLGFAEIFDKIVKKLGFKSKVHTIYDYDKVKGHARNMVYVKDDKYSMNGIYTFDLTYGNKKDDSDRHFDSYFYFARSDELFSKIDKFYGNNYVDEKMEILESTVDKIVENKSDEITSDDLQKINSIYK